MKLQKISACEWNCAVPQLCSNGPWSETRRLEFAKYICNNCSKNGHTSSFRRKNNDDGRQAFPLSEPSSKQREDPRVK